METMDKVNRLMSLWFLTLEKQSCEHLQSNAKGVLQAALLSFVSLRFTPRHLEFHSHPNDLQRSFLIRRLYFDYYTSFNISVHINEENKAIILVSLDRYRKYKYLFLNKYLKLY